MTAGLSASLLAVAVFWASLALIVYTYAGYPLILWLLTRRERRRRPPEVPAGELPTLSVLIAAYNEEAVIPAKLKNCAGLDYPADKIEFLFGSDGSDDRTEALVRTCGAPNVRLFCFARRGKAAVINDLMPQARGDIVVFTDANTLLDPAAVSRLARRFQDPCVGGVCGRLVLDRDHASSSRLLADEANYWQFENLIKRLEGELGLLAAANGAIYAIRRRLFRPLPTVRPIADDLLIPAAVLKHHAHMVYEPAAVAHESGWGNTRVELLRKIRVGEIAYNSLPALWPLLWPGHGRVAWALWSHKVIRWAAPFLLLALLAASTLLWAISFYRVCLLLQLLLYASALAGYWLDGHGQLPLWLSLPYYFVGSNLALLLGFGHSLARSTSGTWTRIGR